MNSMNKNESKRLRATSFTIANNNQLGAIYKCLGEYTNKYFVFGGTENIFASCTWVKNMFSFEFALYREIKGELFYLFKKNIISL